MGCNWKYLNIPETECFPYLLLFKDDLKLIQLQFWTRIIEFEHHLYDLDYILYSELF